LKCPCFGHPHRFRYDGNGDEPSNSILQRALIRYVNTQCAELVGGLQQAEYTLQKRKRAESEPPTETADGDGRTDRDDEDTEAAEEQRRTQDHDYTVNHVPVPGVWVDLKNQIKFMR
jgi:hypothetical protein